MLITLKITPLVITFDEEPNIERTLRALQWARRVVLVDSGSTDRTVEIVHGFPNALLLSNPFESFGAQWRFAIAHGEIGTDYVMPLDADMRPTSQLLDELEARFLPGNFDAALVPFEMHVLGRPLWGTLYPADHRVFRPSAVEIGDRGQHHEFRVRGTIYRCRNRIIHDDRKPLDRWAANQLAYSRAEAERLLSTRRLSLRQRLRRSGFMPPLAWIYAYLRAGGPFAGRAALRYAHERMVTEGLKAIRLLEIQTSKEQCLPEEPNSVKGSRS